MSPVRRPTGGRRTIRHIYVRLIYRPVGGIGARLLARAHNIVSERILLDGSPKTRACRSDIAILRILRVAGSSFYIREAENLNLGEIRFVAAYA